MNYIEFKLSWDDHNRFHLRFFFAPGVWLNVMFRDSDLDRLAPGTYEPFPQCRYTVHFGRNDGRRAIFFTDDRGTSHRVTYDRYGWIPC